MKLNLSKITIAFLVGLSISACSVNTAFEKKNLDKTMGKALLEAKEAQTIHPQYGDGDAETRSKEVSQKFNAYVQGSSVQSAGKDKMSVDTNVGND